MNALLQAVKGIDNALHVASVLTALEASGETDGGAALYKQMRAHLAAGLDSLRAVDAPEVTEPRKAINWVLAHILPLEDVNAAVRVAVNPRPLDPRLHPFASVYGRAQWLHETQRERLMAAGEQLRDAADRATVGAVSRAEVMARLLAIPGMTDKNAHGHIKRGGLIEISPDMFTAASVEKFISKRKAKGVQSRQDNLDFDID